MIDRGAPRRRGPGGLAVLALAGLAALGGCRERNGGEITATVIGERLPQIVDPVTKAPTTGDAILLSNAAQGLVRFDPAGNIAPGLAERWAVSDDGLSYIFRLEKANWSDGRRVRARDVVRLIERQLQRKNGDATRDTVGAIAQVVAMTDRVIAIELSSPRPHLLQLLAQPAFALVRDSKGTGPFAVATENNGLLLSRVTPGLDGDEGQREQVRVESAPAEKAVAAFVAGKTDLVLGGTVGDLSFALGAKLPRNSLRIDPVAGLAGLVPARKDGPGADLRVRALLDEAIDRAALVGALGVPDLQPRASLLQAGLDGVTNPYQPAWTGLAPADRSAALLERARTLFAEPAVTPAKGAAPAEAEPAPRPVIRIALPEGPGGAIILSRLQTDWQPLGLTVEAAGPGKPADFRWVDQVAPSTSPAWFLRSFRCEFVPVCSEEADQLLDAARLTGFAPQRNAFFADAERMMRDAVLFIPVTAPIRWSLTDRSIDGFAENRFAVHTLMGLRERANTQD
ncbi:ABC transporter substrate-binding protein [Sphingomonas rosea]|uniref:ABC transporter substrate-binding protein n=1 Tax=Sphingomonas rosea TaxID=335605 RepID=A0ABP7U451_9SPHN